jgi:hypothetical protein
MENHENIEPSLLETIIHGTNICDMSDTSSNQCFEKIIETKNNDDYDNLKNTEKVKYEHVKCEEINHEQSSFNSSFKWIFSNVSLSQFNPIVFER